MKKKLHKVYRIRRLLLAFLIVIAIVVTSIYLFQRKAGKESNEKQIFDFLTSEMGLNTAAACGVLANIEEESGFSSDSLEKGYTWSQGGGYGICQWTNYPRTSTTGRRTDLVDWCVANDLDYKSLAGQLEYLKYELYNDPVFTDSVTEKLQSVSDDADGAYEAGYYWCYYYEVPEGYDDGVSEDRGDTAKYNYWPKYSETEEV